MLITSQRRNVISMGIMPRNNFRWSLLRLDITGSLFTLCLCECFGTALESLGGAIWKMKRVAAFFSRACFLAEFTDDR